MVIFDLLYYYNLYQQNNTNIDTVSNIPTYTLVSTQALQHNKARNTERK